MLYKNNDKSITLPKKIDIESFKKKYKKVIQDALKLDNKYNYNYFSTFSKLYKSVINAVLSGSKKPHIIIDSGSKVLLAFCKQMEDKGLVDISIVNPGKEFNITDVDITKFVIRTSKLLVIDYINNTTGLKNNLKNIIKLCKEKNIKIFCHVDYGVCDCVADINGVDYISIDIYKSNLLISYEDIVSQNLNIENNMLSLSTIVKYKDKSHFKKIFIDKMEEMIDIITYDTYKTIYSQSLSNITAITFNNNVNNLLTICFVSIKSKLSFAKIDSPHIIYNPIIDTGYIDDYIKQGTILISFNKVKNIGDVKSIILTIVKYISARHINFMDEIKLNILAKKKLNEKTKQKKTVRFNPKLYIKKTKRHNTNGIKSILKRSKYR